MAKTKAKGTNAKIKELKGIKPEKVTDEQLKSIQTIVDKINNAQMQIGQLEARKHQILHMIAGTNDINIKDGTINYPAENGEVNS